MKQVAVAAERNKDPILKVLKKVLDDQFGPNRSLKLLEISSGTGQHAAHFAAALPHITFQPSEYDNTSLKSIASYVADAALPNLLPPLLIDVAKPPSEWPSGPLSGCRLDVILCVNMIHITPWNCTLGLFEAASSLLRPGGLLITYGPYACDGVVQPDSNVRFNASLKSRDASWGLRDTRVLEREALQRRLLCQGRHGMPANNHTIVYLLQE